MSDVSAIASTASSLQQTQLQTQVQVSLLKTSMESQKQIMQMLLESMGVGTQINLQA